MSFKRFLLCVGFGIAMGFLPAVASAQSTIAGVVTDDSGGVLPGVSVEVASPALIEKVRTVVSDGQGRYSVTDVRPGEYTVTFILQGFTTVRREGVAVASGATVPINGELRIGTLNETVTVTGASPVVDVQTTARRQVVDRALLEALPNIGNVATVAALVPGVRLDVGAGTGSSRIAQTYAVARGLVNIKETTWNVDGLPASSMQAPPPPGYHSLDRGTRSRPPCSARGSSNLRWRLTSDGRCSGETDSRSWPTLRLRLHHHHPRAERGLRDRRNPETRGAGDEDHARPSATYRLLSARCQL